ncbi:MAG TPA: hypothetical protein VNA68_01805 [Candidatus Dormibacteraeota bacterium]|nr:hypothetical protein [Candidatus Dormibacteraeota bacterium]
MSLEALCAMALHKGAGVSLREVKRSEAYQRELARERTLHIKHPLGTHRGGALRAEVFGHLLNGVGEKTALRAIRNLPDCKTQPGGEESALITVVGQHLTNAAIQQLPDNIKETAATFGDKKADADLQISLLKGLLYLRAQLGLDKREDQENAEGIFPPGLEWLGYLEEKRKIDRFLPYRYPSLAEDEFPTCLGMSALLMGFAKLTGARYMFCTVLEDKADEFYRYKVAVLEAILADLDFYPKSSAKTILRRALLQGLKVSRRLNQRISDWHHGLAIELCDGRWAYVDPYQSSFGVFGSEWNIPEIVRLQSKYGEVIPGLALTGYDGGLRKQWYSREYKKVLEALKQARSLQYNLGDSVQRFTDMDNQFEELVSSHPEFDFLNRLIRDALKVRKLEPTAAVIFKLLFMYQLSSKKASRRGREEMTARYQSFWDNPADREEMLSELLVQFHYYAYWRVAARNESYAAKNCIQPALEFSRPDHGLALATLSNLSSWTNQKLPATLLMEHSNSQMLWHEAMSPLPEISKLSAIDRVIVKDLALRMQRLPVLHRRCQTKLATLAELKQKVRGNEQEEQKDRKADG